MFENLIFLYCPSETAGQFNFAKTMKKLLLIPILSGIISIAHAQVMFAMDAGTVKCVWVENPELIPDSTLARQLYDIPLPITVKIPLLSHLASVTCPTKGTKFDCYLNETNRFLWKKN